MLPNVKTMKTTALSALLAISLAIPAAPALAWGQREQDVLKGVVGTLAVAALLREADKNHREKQPKPRYYYVEPQPQYTHTPRPTHNSYNSVYGTPAAQAFNSYSYRERQTIQRRLAAKGYYYGGIDAAFGPGTYNAVVAYARDTGNRDSIGSRNGAFSIYDGLIY